MRRPHYSGLAVLAVLALSVSMIAQGQQRETADDQTTARGVELYNQGNTGEAIIVLTIVVKKHPDDADAWYYLGLAQYSEGWFAGAGPSFEKTLELRPQLADAHAKLAYALILANESSKALATARRALELGDQSVEAHYAIAEASLRRGDPDNAIAEATSALKIKPEFLPALITKSFAHLALKQYSESAENLEKFLALSPDDADAKIWRNQLLELRSRASEPPGQPPGHISSAFNRREVTQKARVLSKPEPGYTERARKAGAVGTVVLKCVFASDGEVKNIFVYRALGYGLTSQAISAARAIKFAPAIKDGHSAGQYMQLEYTFNLY